MAQERTFTEDQMIEVLHGFVASIGGTPRDGQDAMARAVWRSLHARSKDVFDAPTGAGKSISLMVPMLLSGKKSVISTGTKALQDQYLRDLPVLLAHLARKHGVHATGATLKGISNFACLDAMDDPNLFVDPEDRALVDQWVKTSETGEWDSGPKIRRATSEALSVTSDDCLRKACDHYERCFAMHAKQRAAEADLLIINHALWSLDVKTGGKILPEHDAVALDECHAAFEFLATALGGEFSVSFASGSERGSIPAALSAAQRVLEDHPSFARISKVAPSIRRAILDRAQDIVDKRIPNPSMPGGVARIDPSLWDFMAEASAALRHAADALKTLPISEDDKRTQARRDGAVRRCANLADLLDAMGETKVGQVAFVEPVKNPSTGEVTSAKLKLVDVAIADLIDESGWHEPAGRRPTGEPAGEPRSAIMCSGTVPPRYEVEMGMPEATVHPIASPFDYDDLLLYVPDALTPPSGAGGDARRHQDEAIREGVELLRVSLAQSKGALVLCTSHASSSTWADAVRRAFPDVEVFNPTDSQDKNAAIAEALEHERFVVCASQGWYEGVDMPGRLNLVIVDKAPMPLPTDPIQQAKKDVHGKNSFQLVTVAHVAAKLGQASGRLMRRHGDRGVIAILDPRLRVASWCGSSTGRTNLWEKLPPAPDTSSREDALAFLRGERIERRAPSVAPVRTVAQRRNSRDFDIPDGWYRIPNIQGEPVNVEVQIGTGRWDGFRFVRDDRGRSLSRDAAMVVLGRIEQVGTGEALAAYGRATGECGLCSRRLTTPESVEAGIGPKCASRLRDTVAA